MVFAPFLKLVSYMSMCVSQDIRFHPRQCEKIKGDCILKGATVVSLQKER